MLEKDTVSYCLCNGNERTRALLCGFFVSSTVGRVALVFVEPWTALDRFGPRQTEAGKEVWNRQTLQSIEEL